MACAATWPCSSCPMCSNAPGASGPISSGRRRPSRCGANIRTSCSWPRSTGTWNGRCSSRASTTPTTSGLYDRLREHHARPVREHFCAGMDFQDKLARFLENHDEPRAAATFAPAVHAAAAVLTYLSPGLRFFHQGQFEGRRTRISPHLVRGPNEPVDDQLAQFYARLLPVLRQPMRSRRSLVLAGMRSRLARQRDVGQLHRLPLGTQPARVAVRGRELLAAAKPMLRPHALPGTRGSEPFDSRTCSARTATIGRAMTC